MSSSLFSIGFRPFYLGAAALAAVAVPAWYGAYSGWLLLPAGLPPMAWHAHVMVFAFAGAVIGGFLLTAVRAWTGLPTLSGPALAGLFGLWVAARVVMLTGPGPLAAALDLSFFPLLAVAVGIPLWRARNARNAFVVAVLVLLGALTALHQGAWRGWVDGVWAMRAPTAAMDTVALLLTVIGGRIIPAFSANAVRGLTPRRWLPLEMLAIGLVGVILAADVTGLAALIPAALLRALFAVTAGVHLLRLLGWQPWATRHNVLLAALPAGYLWLPVHFALRAWLDTTPAQMAPLALHALSVGAMAGLMLAMMTRSARGHTGRALTAGAGETFMFTAVHLAALSRVAGPLIWPAGHGAWLGASAGLWALAFAAFAIRYTPIVTRPRVDAPGTP